MPSKTVTPDTTTTSSTLKNDEPTVWYLAYGSNMDPKVFTGRRKITPIESMVVTVPNYWLSFDIGGMPYVEPCFASILKMNPARFHDKEYALEVHNRTKYGREFLWDETHPEHPQRSYPPILQGVAHRITWHQWQMVIQSEGGWGYDVPTGYNQIQVDCNVTGTNEQISAYVLEARPLSVKSQCQPTARYKNLLTAGAAHHQLEPSYQRYLEGIVPYECVGLGPKTARILLGLVNFPTIIVFGIIIFMRSRPNPAIRPRPPPYAVAWIIDKFNRYSNMIHDNIIAPIFGTGRHSSEKQLVVMRKRIQAQLEDGKTASEHQASREAEADQEGPALKIAEQAVESVAE